MLTKKLNWTAITAVTVTNLHSLPASATWVAGWEGSASDFDNSTNKYCDCRLSGKLVLTSSNNKAGQIRIYLVGMLDDSTWPDVMDGTESVETWTAADIIDSCARQALSFAVSATAGKTYPFEIPSVKSVFNSNMPKKFNMFITGDAATSTNAQFASSGSIINTQWQYETFE